MPTDTPLTDQMNALTQYINTVTSGSDMCLSDAVATLADGYGQGGGSGAIKTGTITFSEDTQSGTAGTVEHGLGAIPDVFVVWCDDFANLTAETPLTYSTATMVGGSYVRLPQFTQRLTSTVYCEGFTNVYSINANDWKTNYTITSVSYKIPDPTTTEFTLPKAGASVWYRAGVTYKWMAMSLSADEKLPLDSLAKKLNGELTVYHSNSVKTIGYGGLRDAGTITHLVLPNLETIAATAYLLAIRSLIAVDFGPVDNIRQQLFYNDSNLTTIVLRKNTVVPINGTAFQGTPFASGGAGGEIYIPKVLYDHLGDGTASDYKATTNWSTFDGYGTITWRQIEGSQYENYYVDGTLIGSDDEYGEKITGDTYADHSYPQGAIEVTVTNLLQQTFRERTGITSFSAPNCTTMGGYQFYHCTALERISFPKLTNISTSNAFDGCTALVGAVFPAISNVPNMNSAFLGCTSLAYADFGSGLNYLNGSNMFKNCSNLKTVIIRKTSAVSQLTALNHFDGSPFASDGTGGTLYVPSALISSYQSATNWSTILGYTNNQILPIEGSIYETQYADGTPIE